MQEAIARRVLEATGARAIRRAVRIQSLWSGYGEIVRLELDGGGVPSAVLKLIQPPQEGRHPRGWNTGRSHRRKLRSYAIETHWYQHYARCADDRCPMPACLAAATLGDATLLLLTDLDAAGFALRKEQVELADIHACLEWLAAFHATYLGSDGAGLWERGSYWHLATRPDELAALDDLALQRAAPLIDQALRECRYPTLVHGDAKLANFCFSPAGVSPPVAAVDFQYAGPGCGVQDVAYFLGSCLYEEECEALAETLQDYYFEALVRGVSRRHPEVDSDALVMEWRGLYDVAWADFHRFLKGWSPDHWKLNSYSERLTRRVIQRLS